MGIEFFCYGTETEARFPQCEDLVDHLHLFRVLNQPTTNDQMSEGRVPGIVVLIPFELPGRGTEARSQGNAEAAKMA